MTNAHVIASNLQIPLSSVEAVIELLESGATIPFISRYRKEVTGSLDEVAIFEIQRQAKMLDELEARKQYILKTIDEQGKLTDELRQQIESTYETTILEDLYPI